MWSIESCPKAKQDAAGGRDAKGRRLSALGRRDLNDMANLRTSVGLFLVCLALLPSRLGAGGNWLNLGPAYDQFELTLEEGRREEWVGPFYYEEDQLSEKIWAVPPVLAYSKDPATETARFILAYPALSYTRSGEQYRWQFFQLLSFAGGPTQTEEYRDRFTLFPLFFLQRSSDPEQNYLAAGPFYGHLRGRLMRDEIRYVLFPLYSQTRKRDVVTDNYLYPFFHLRKGDGLSGWQFWPLFGTEHKEVTTRTDNFGEVETIGGHDRTFVLWPIFASQRAGMGTTNEAMQQALLPLYSLTRSDARDATTILWPFFSRIEDRARQYTEWHAPWPFLIFASGPGKTTTRFWPIYSHAQSSNQLSDFYLWPVYRYNRLNTASLERKRKRVLFFLYSDVKEKNLETGRDRRRRDFLPLFTWRRGFDGAERLQVLAPLEPVLPGNRKIELEYSPIWSLWRSEKNPATGASSQSLLWNLYRREVRADTKQVSALFGLFQTRRHASGSSLRILFIPFKGGANADGTSPAKDASPRDPKPVKGNFDESIAPRGN